MARVKKALPTLENLVFATPEQKVLRFLLSEPTTSFTPRVISSKLKGIRGLGGSDGISRILAHLQELHMVDWVDNHRAIRLHDDNPFVQQLKVIAAVCDLEGLKQLLEPVSSRGVLFGSRANGRSHTESDYDLYVVTDTPDDVRRITEQHPLGRRIELLAVTPEAHSDLDQNEPALAEKLAGGVVMWGASW